MSLKIFTTKLIAKLDQHEQSNQICLIFLHKLKSSLTSITFYSPLNRTKLLHEDTIRLRILKKYKEKIKEIHFKRSSDCKMSGVEYAFMLNVIDKVARIGSKLQAVITESHVCVPKKYGNCVAIPYDAFMEIINIQYKDRIEKFNRTDPNVSDDFNYGDFSFYHQCLGCRNV